MLADVNAWLPPLGDLRLFAPELVLVGTIAAVLLVPLVAGRNPLLAGLIAMAGTVLALVATGGLAPRVADGPQGAFAAPGYAAALLADRFSVFFKLLLFAFLVLVIWLWLTGAAWRVTRPVRVGAIGGPEFFVLLLTSALGMLLMVGSLNLVVLLVAIETASLPSYALVASDRRSRMGAEAALKYVTFGAASAAIMVYGISLLFGRFGTLDLGAIATHLAAHPGTADTAFWIGLAAFAAGVLFKIAAVPMHLWCPDVFEGAPVEITTWLSVASKAAGLGLLLRVVTVLGPAPLHVEVATPLAWGVGVVAALTCTVGNLAALRQESVKRTLAYSSIAHAGYMMMAAAITLSPTAGGGGPGFTAVVAYLMVYVVMNLGAFGVTALVVWQTGSDHLSSFTALGRRAPWLAVPMAVCLFSLVGLPPLGGFTAKWYLLVALGKGAVAQPWLWILVAVAVINTALSLYYYVRIIRQMFLVENDALPAVPAPLGGVALVTGCAIVVLLLGTLWFNPLGERATILSERLFGLATTAERSQLAMVAPAADSASRAESPLTGAGVSG